MTVFQQFYETSCYCSVSYASLIVHTSIIALNWKIPSVYSCLATQIYFLKVSAHLSFAKSVFKYPLNLSDIVLSLLPLFLLLFTLVQISDSMNPQYLCKICKNEVKDNNPSVCCDICKMWSHIECVNISSRTYVNLQCDVVSA